MPKIFKESERNRIIEDLRSGAAECLGIYGVKKTTVDELVRRANIAKGTFYLFYDSKEALFADVLITFEERVEGMYLEMLQNLDENHIVTSLTDVFTAIAMKTYEDGIFRFFENSNIDLVQRKLPEKNFREVTTNARSVFRNLFSYFSIDNEDDIEAFTDGYNAIIRLFTEAEHIPQLEKTIRFLIRGLVLQMVE
ncbi:MAG: TetR/AcrR family transcriptional regulator [Spirochaetales bacterium]|nr:TetR/AcrR family transcriptional regulator [Candidatus Physcosoma equi]